MIFSKLLDDLARQRVGRNRPVSPNFGQIIPLTNAVGAQHQGISGGKRLASDVRGADCMAEHARLSDQCSTPGPEDLAVSVADMHEVENQTFGVEEAGDDYRAATSL